MQSCARRLPQSHPKPYQSPLWEHLETIRALRRKHQTWAAIALHLKESHGLKTTSASVLKFLPLRCFVWVVLRLGDGWDGQREFAGPVIGGGSEVDEVLESSSHSLC